MLSDFIYYPPNWPQLTVDLSPRCAKWDISCQYLELTLQQNYVLPVAHLQIPGPA
jgi:hypothetical protein